MSEEIEDLEQDDLLDDDQPKSKLGPIVIVAIGLLIGAVPGYSMIGPRLAPGMAEKALAAPDDGHGGGGGHGGDSEGEERPIHVVDNLVVNPARSGGTRFLLTTIAIETEQAGQVALLEAYEYELRDALLVVLGAKTTNELADITGRAAIVDEITAAVVDIVGDHVIYRVYLPQWVIQ